MKSTLRDGEVKMARFRSVFAVPVLAIALVASTGCATVLGGGSTQAVSIRAEPAGTAFVVRSSSGLQMSSGVSPQQITLARKNEYEIEFSSPGYQTQRLSLLKGLNGWVWLNIVGGGVLGGVIDVISGAAWKLEPAIVDMRLVKASGSEDMAEMHVRMYDKQGKLLRELTIPMLPAE
jgi:hypothetical protein